MRKNFYIIGLCLLFLLTACSDTNPTLTATATVATTTSPTQPATHAVSTTQAITTTTIVSTQTTAANTAPVVVSTATPTSNTPTMAVATVTPPPTASPVPATATPAAMSWKALGEANCCENFGFTTDGRIVYYQPTGKTGSWVLDPASGQSTFLTANFISFTPDLTLAAATDRASGTTKLQDLTNGQVLGTLSNSASQTIFSPDKKQVAYLLRAAKQDGPEEPQYFSVWVAGTDGKNVHSIWSGRETANLAWFPDSQRLLLTGRDEANKHFGLWSIGLDGTAKLLVESKGLTVASLSPDGQWVAYWITLQGPDQSGVWVAHADGGGAQKMSWAGGVRWAGDHTLYYVPVRQPGETTSILWEYDPDSAISTQLTDPAKFPLQIALDQWQISPDGQSMAFRNSTDNALWWLRLG